MSTVLLLPDFLPDKLSPCLASSCCAAHWKPEHYSLWQVLMGFFSTPQHSAKWHPVCPCSVGSGYWFCAGYWTPSRWLNVPTVWEIVGFCAVPMSPNPWVLCEGLISPVTPTSWNYMACDGSGASWLRVWWLPWAWVRGIRGVEFNDDLFSVLSNPLVNTLLDLFNFCRRASILSLDDFDTEELGWIT